MMTRNVLELPTLVLNRNWHPVHVTTVVRALVMLWNETAKAVEPDEFRLYDWAECARTTGQARGPGAGPGPAARAGAAHGVINDNAPASGQAGALFRGVLLGEQRASRTRAQG